MDSTASPIEYRYLPAFLKVADTLNFSVAGRDLGIAQSAVSRQIRLLEAAFGFQLLHRNPKKVVLTPQGEELYRQLRAFDDWSLAFQGRLLREIRIGSLEGILRSSVLPQLTGKSTNKGQEISANLSFAVMTNEEIQESLEAGKLELGVSNLDLQTSIISSRLYRKEVLVLISKKPIDLEAVHKHPWITGPTGQTMQKFSKLQPPKKIRVSALNLILELVEAGEGISIVPDHCLNESLKLVRKKLKAEKSIYLNIPNYQIVPQPLRVALERLSNK